VIRCCNCSRHSGSGGGPYKRLDGPGHFYPAVGQARQQRMLVPTRTP
jgi:hypothetical protein